MSVWWYSLNCCFWRALMVYEDAVGINKIFFIAIQTMSFLQVVSPCNNPTPPQQPTLGITVCMHCLQEACRDLPFHVNGLPPETSVRCERHAQSQARVIILHFTSVSLVAGVTAQGQPWLWCVRHKQTVIKLALSPLYNRRITGRRAAPPDDAFELFPLPCIWTRRWILNNCFLLSSLTGLPLGRLQHSNEFSF